MQDGMQFDPLSLTKKEKRILVALIGMYIGGYCLIGVSLAMLAYCLFAMWQGQ